MLLALGACGPDPGVPGRSAPAGPTATGRSADSISFMVFGDPAELDAYRALVEGFAARRTDIPVTLVHVPDQSAYRERLGSDFAAGTPADIFLVNYRRFAPFADADVLEPVGPYLERSSVVHADDFYAQSLEPFVYRGETWCLPQNLSSLVVYYNAALFEAAGLAVPPPDWTWDDLLRLARALTRDLDGDGRTDQFGLGVEPSLLRVAPFVWQNGGSLVNFEGHPTRLALDQPAAFEAVRWFVELQTVHRVVPNAVEEASEDAESRFLNGRLAMFLNSRRGVPTYRASAAFDWDVAALPAKREAAGVLHADAFCMAAASAAKDSAWAFIEFASSPEGQRILARSGRTVPSRPDVAESDAFLDPNVHPASSRVFLDTIPVIRRVPVHPAWVEVETRAGEEIERAFYGQTSVDEAVRAAVALSIEEFER